MKRYYNLIGNETQLEEWFLTYKDYLPTYPQVIDFHKMLTASSWPVLFYEQIPERLLTNNPGFPILLRQEVSIPLPNWVHQPLLPGTKDFSNRYFIKTPNDRKPERILFSVAHTVETTWQKLCLQYPAKEHRWIWNAGKIDDESMPPFPDEFKLGMGDLVYLRKYIPDLMLDLSFGLSDTYTPLHMFSLHYGCDLELVFEPLEHSSAKSKDLNRSKWLIYR